MDVSELIASILEREGVKTVIGFPHSEIFDAAAKRGIKPIITRTERVAIHMAEGFTRMSDGRVTGVATAQYGPGAENAFGAIAQAYADNAPILFLPTGYPRGNEATAPNFHSGRNYRNIAKWSESAVKSERLPQMLHYAFSQLRNGGPRPVVLELPTDLLAEQADANSQQYSSPSRSTPAASSTEIGQLLDMLLQAERPVIYAGQGVLYAQAWNELTELAELLQAPVLTTLNGKSAFPENHPLALGTGGKSRPDTVDHFLENADFVLGIGTSFTRSLYVTPVPDGKSMAQVTLDGGHLGKDYPINFGVIGDARVVLSQLLSEAKSLRNHDNRYRESGVTEEIASLRKSFMAKWMPHLTSERQPISPYRVVWELMHAVNRQRAVVTHDAGHPRDQMSPFYEAVVPHGYMGWGHTTQLGTGLGLMMGAKLARPDWLAVNLMGEAAFGMVATDFETSVRAELPILTIVLRNEIMGGYGRYMPTASKNYGANRLSGEYADIARALGGYADQVGNPSELGAALQRCIREVEEGRSSLLEVKTYEEPRIPGLVPPT